MGVNSYSNSCCFLRSFKNPSKTHVVRDKHKVEELSNGQLQRKEALRCSICVLFVSANRNLFHGSWNLPYETHKKPMNRHFTKERKKF